MTRSSEDLREEPLKRLLAERRRRRRAEMAPLSVRILEEVKPEREPEDREFLPAALALLETPPAPRSSQLVFAICALLTTAIGWSWFGHLDVYADASGKIQPVGRTKVIQPLVSGKVVNILVRDGDRVKRGDVLVELDPTEALAGRSVAADKLMNTEAEIVRRKAALAAASRADINVSVKLDWSDSIPGDVKQREEDALRAGLSNLSATLNGLRTQKQQKISERDRYVNNIAAQKAVIDVVKEQVSMVQNLNEKGWNSRSQLLTQLLSQRQAELTLAGLQGSLSEAEAAIPVIDSQIAKAREGFVETNTDKLVQLLRQREDYKQQLTKATAQVEHMALIAPAAGTISASAVTTIGQVVTTGQQLMQLVPIDGGLELEAYILNTDAGFVRVGQEAIIRVDAFPFTRYGTLTGRVTRIARDAIPGVEAARQQKNGSQPLSSSGTLSPTSAAQQTQDLVFPVTIVSDRSGISVDGKMIPLSPGMTVSVQIKTESRRAIDYILSPLQATISSAAQER